LYFSQHLPGVALIRLDLATSHADALSKRVPVWMTFLHTSGSSSSAAAAAGALATSRRDATMSPLASGATAVRLDGVVQAVTSSAA